ncbi:hypothetical protein [Oscillatoria sp. FACHB-1406]|uniref:hypothetical protein n=1 Tax=Oscillatoria sp. FACHB-1406 TaxID=2692846 RepID=UPI00168206F6|nr:hypothetical protein [Oscillatoria sp. FACHB-1406]MBD2580211.1 hypothetical protein [Oscillatoria sp. FACHB-1406]
MVESDRTARRGRMGAFILGLMLGVLAGVAIAFGLSRKQLAEAEREKQLALRQQREVLEGDRELRLRSLSQTLQADCNLRLQAQELALKAKISAIEARNRQQLDERETTLLAPELTEPELEPLNNFQQYESLLDLLDEDEETED